MFASLRDAVDLRISGRRAIRFLVALLLGGTIIELAAVLFLRMYTWGWCDGFLSAVRSLFSDVWDLLLVFFGMLYVSGSWTALLAAVSTRHWRFWRPMLERKAAASTLFLLALIAMTYCVNSTATQHTHSLSLQTLLEFTCLLWPPEIVLYLILWPLLRPEADDAIEPPPIIAPHLIRPHRRAWK